jgi:acyl-coenzyme A synthetase/AMP-(fatty) acid ligase
MDGSMCDRDLRDVSTGFWHQVNTRPEAVALIWHQTTTSYGELGFRVRAAARRFESLGLGPSDPLAILVEKSPEAVALVLACLDAGRRFLLPSPKLDRYSLAQLFDQIGCAASCWGDGRSATQIERHDRHGQSPVDGDVSFMLTTSGSTGLPKIVPIPNEGIRRFGSWARLGFGIGSGTTVFNYAPLNFDLCFLDTWATLTVGGRTVLVTAEESVRPHRLAKLLVDHGVEILQAVPMCFGLLGDVDATFPSVRAVASTGDVMPPRTLANLPRQFPNARLFNIYGCTETNDSFVHELSESDLESGTVPIGRPIEGVRAVVIDEDGRPLPEGTASGELTVATPFQSRGYLDAARNADKFVVDPTGLTDDIFFRTGDLVERDVSGTAVLVGRQDFQVKVRGVAVNTTEIELALLDHPEVVEAAVVAVADPPMGQRLHAAVRRRPSSNLHSLELRKHCAERLPQAAVPSVMTILDVPLPRTSTGKPDRRAIAEFRRPPHEMLSAVRIDSLIEEFRDVS